MAHLLIVVDTETLLLGDTGQLDILGIKLLFHDLLQRLEHQRLGLCKSQRLVVFILQLRLRAFAS